MYQLPPIPKCPTCGLEKFEPGYTVCSNPFHLRCGVPVAIIGPGLAAIHCTEDHDASVHVPPRPTEAISFGGNTTVITYDGPR